MKSLTIIGCAALLPMATGPLPTDKNTLTLALCDGSALTIPIGGDDSDGEDEPVPCSASGCHAGNSRKQFDPMRKRGA